MKKIVSLVIVLVLLGGLFYYFYTKNIGNSARTGSESRLNLTGPEYEKCSAILGLDKEKCLIAVYLELGKVDSNFCSRDDVGDANYCNYIFAEKLNKTDYCPKIQTEVSAVTDQCFENVAFRNINESACSKISDTGRRAKCVNAVQKGI